MKHVRTNIHYDHVLLYGLGVTGRSILNTLPLLGTRVSVINDGPIDLDDLLDPEIDRGLIDLVSEEQALPWSSIDVVVKAPVIPLDKPLIQEARRRGLGVYSDLELLYLLVGGERLIAITGSNGKTTTTSMVAALLNGAGRKAIACGNIGYPVFDAFREATDDTWLVCEASSFQLASVETFAPHIAAILNITPDHLDWHGSFEAYADCKARVGSQQKKEDVLFLNPTDSISQTFLQEGRFTGRTLPIDRMGAMADQIRKPGFWTLIGPHNVDNALFAAGICQEAGLNPVEILEGLSHFHAIEHRMEWVAEVDGVTYINDSKATNVDSAVRAIRSLEAPIILIAGGFDKKVPFDDLYEAFRERGKAMLLLGQTRDQLRQGMEQAGMGERVHLVDTLKEAVALGARLAERGDVVMLSPASASWGMYHNFEERGREFKDLVAALKETKSTDKA